MLLLFNFKKFILISSSYKLILFLLLLIKLLCEIGLKLILTIFTPFFNLKLLFLLFKKGSLCTSPFIALLFIFKLFTYLFFFSLFEPIPKF